MQRWLPLGVDIGAARVRIAALRSQRDGSVRLEAVGAADVAESAAVALRAALEQVDTPERSCIATVRSAEARLRSIVLPTMQARHAQQVIRFEGAALFDCDEREAIAVRSSTKRLEDGRRQALIAAAPARRVKEIIALLAGAGLRAVCIDHEACALARMRQLPLLDVGLTQSTLIAMSEGLPFARTLPIGGASFTQALMAEFGMSLDVAEARKRTIGLGGAGAHALDGLARAVTEELQAIPQATPGVLYVCGNGARLVGLRERIHEESGVDVQPVTLRASLASGLPAEVERSAAVDWFVAVAAAFPSPEALSCIA